MLIIKKISANIKVKEQMDTFGFEYEFSDGLNIITGENSSGKSSILSCIYYNLGLEQLLGMSKNSILDKCITSDFIYRQTSYKVLESFIELVIENEKGEKATLYRDAICIDGSTGAFIKVTTDNLSKRYYLQAKNDHNDKHGFYHWLQEFIGIQLPRDKETGKNILYSQNLFSACLIEQTKGWSELFSQMPPFSMKGIKDIKSKLVEYLLDLECFYQDFEKDKLKN
ncbi:AAA domain protein [Photobacterium leiognathi lrivu.4.1]|uniref:AAA domain protein n=1 Tax=Photobacterium leiognathi lrivu.4.1 TaxID=1248232 RepID=V5H374_PHOLE|nr:AAA family ATPase [Photobacterium leiognathi]GAD31527.1 AAA domain protein [Photobacterium leiognathi lrivu.4.1]